MPTRKYIILLSGLFLGLFFLPFSAKAQEDVLAETLALPAITITGYNVLCEGDQETTLIATTSLAAASFRWYMDGAVIPGETTNTLIITVTNPETVFSVAALSAGDLVLGTSQPRRVFVTTAPIITEANRVNDTLCTYEYREAILGMINTTANYFAWGFDPAVNPHLIGDVVNQWSSLHTQSVIDITVWYQQQPIPHVVRTVLTVKMSTHPFSHPLLVRPYYENRCFTTDWASIEIGLAQFDFAASPTNNLCQGDTVILTVDNVLHGALSIEWSTGNQANQPSAFAEIGDGETFLWAEVTDIYGCIKRDTIILYGMPRPQNVYITATDTTVCEGLSTQLTVHCPTCQSFFWNTHQDTESITLSPPGGLHEFYVSAYSGPNQGGCYATARILIRGVNCETIHFPNAIRLSSQHGNNVWQPILEPVDGTDYWFAIFNSWGQLIFESDDMSVGWDGTHNGQNVRPGVYVFVFRLSNMHRSWERTGTITVVD